VDGGETGVACRGAVVPIGLEMVEECEHGVGGEILEVERNDGALVASREES
jgi:hypothetical protein